PLPPPPTLSPYTTLFRSYPDRQRAGIRGRRRIGSAFDHRGVLRLSMGTKSASTIESIQALDEQIDEVSKHPISAAEIKRAKDSRSEEHTSELQSPDQLVC